MQFFLKICALASIVAGEVTFSGVNKAIVYEDCQIFNQPHVYGGPVCGSDGATYANSVFLDCLNHQNLGNVATVHSGACLKSEEYCKTNLYYEPVCGSDNNTYSNVESLLCANFQRDWVVQVRDKGPCEKFDPCHRYGLELYGLNPVCASNGFTYENAAQVKCLQQYNTDLKILHDGGCKIRHVYSLYGSGKEICQVAKTRYEWNPFCGVDGITYSNPFILLCFKPYAGVLSQGECGRETNDACQPVDNYRSLDSSFSLFNGTSDDAYKAEDQVCGSDGKTYSSQQHLQCHTRRDKYLFVKHFGPCAGPDDNPCGALPEEDHRAPVCGSDTVTYVSPEALWCAALRSPGKKLAFLHDGPC